jgi:hypothetical protein
MASVVQKVKDVIHGNNHHDTTSTTHTTGTHGTHGTTGAGLTGTHGVTEGTHGTHNSHVANAADPRIDSDLDGSRTVGNTTHGAHTGTTGGLTGTSHNTHGTTGGLTGTSHNTHGTTGGLTGTSHNTHGTTGGLTGTSHNTTATGGPHSSSLLNKVDPTVNTTTGTHTGTHTGAHTGTGAGFGAGTGEYSGTHAGNSHGNHHTGTTGGISNSTNAGPHDSNFANKLDPTVDSDLDGRGNRHGASTHTGGLTGVSGSHATPGSGTAQNTAGPHNSDLMNKLDPRVDADLDGSRTIGGNKTHAGATAHRDVHDASQVPPSVFAAHHGSPEVLHNDHGHDRERRHSVVSHQEKFSGI